MAKFPYDSMNNGNLLILHIVDNNIANRGFGKQLAVPEQEQIASLEGWLHGTTEDNDDRGGRVGDDGETFPHL